MITNHVTKKNTKDREHIKSFLYEHDIEFDENVEFSVVVKDNERIIATGSFDNYVIKCVCVDCDYQGYNLTNRIVSTLVAKLNERGIFDIFLYTKPDNRDIFLALGFFVVCETDDVILLENNKSSIKKYIERLSKNKKEGSSAALVMNCNPFTNGHRYLVEKASKENEWVHLLMVEEDKSFFSTDERYELIKRGTKDLSNVSVYLGGRYIISSATFPSYFLKDSEKIVKAHANLDLTIFGDIIAPTLGITKRYVGTEPTCMLTNAYNSIMREILPKKGIEVIEINRLSAGDKAISASVVRRLLQDKNFTEMQNLIPPTTLSYLREKYE